MYRTGVVVMYDIIRTYIQRQGNLVYKPTQSKTCINQLNNIIFIVCEFKQINKLVYYYNTK